MDGRASIEVEPRIAGDTAKTIAEARALWWLVDRPNLFVKIPATLAGLPAITACLAEGISINVTLIFSLERYGQVIDAFMAGLEAASDADVGSLASVASFFVSRVDTEVDRRLAAIGGPEAQALRGKAAIANARLAYQMFEERFASARWQALAARGARAQRPLWASTSTKDPAYRDTMYVEELAAPQTVNTMPEATLHATEDHGVLRGNAIEGSYDRPGRCLTTWRRWPSATPTSCACSRRKACRSSPTPGSRCLARSASRDASRTGQPAPADDQPADQAVPDVVGRLAGRSA